MTGIAKLAPGIDADEAIDKLIESRAQQFQEQERLEASSWAESARSYNLAAAAARRQREWYEYHTGLARLHRQLAPEHQEKALTLIDGAKGG